MRFDRDRRGYETTALVEPSARGRGKRLLYWFRTPPGVRVGRAPIDETAIRLLEQHNPDIEFDWTRILKAAPAADVPGRRDRDARDRDQRGRRESRPPQRSRGGGAPPIDPRPPRPAYPLLSDTAGRFGGVEGAPSTGLPAVAWVEAGAAPASGVGERSVEEDLEYLDQLPPVHPVSDLPVAVEAAAAAPELDDDTVSVLGDDVPAAVVAEPGAAEAVASVATAPDDDEGDEPVQVFDARPEDVGSASYQRLGAEGLVRLRARYAEVMARIAERPLDDQARKELQQRAERLNPDAWVTTDEVSAALEQYETVFEGLRGVVGRHPRRRRRGRR